ncbi:hypothetical protein ABZW10_28430 [Kitasatospora sp. NPDC004723]|uniref:hypothetical protein n=1 Tax=Kitasatospora sp. NPDC004723 TaxID=3154288 RepID=UPI0033AFC910
MSEVRVSGPGGEIDVTNLAAEERLRLFHERLEAEGVSLLVEAEVEDESEVEDVIDTTGVEEWARRFADYAGVEYVPLVDVEPGTDATVIRYLFDRRNRFEALSVAMRYVDKGYSKDTNPVRMYRHAEEWLVVAVELENDIFRSSDAK